MEVIDGIPDASSAQVVAVGTFDGLHQGHRAILDGALDHARREGLPAAVLTFEPDPVTVLKGTEPTQRRLLTPEDKRAILKGLGFDRVYEVSFDEDFAATSAEDFVNEILVDRLNAAAVFVGYDFRFGSNRTGDTDYLTTTLDEHGVETVVQEPVKAGGDPVSSTRIRGLLQDGNVRDARQLLGRPYVVNEEIQAGEGRGQSIGFPTLNFPLTKTLHPRTGVYAVWLGTENRFPAVANFGFHPTVGRSDEALLEVHVLDETPAFGPGDTTHVYFGSFIRDERNFDSVDELTEQIDRDVSQARMDFEELERPEKIGNIETSTV